MEADGTLFTAEEERFLRHGQVGRVVTHDTVDGYPHCAPVDYIFHSGRFYFGCDRRSRKVRNLLADDRVAFEVDVYDRRPDGTLDWRGVLIKGRAALLEDEGEKAEAVDLMLEKYPTDTHDMTTTFVVVRPERKFTWGPWDRVQEPEQGVRSSSSERRRDGHTRPA